MTAAVIRGNTGIDLRSLVCSVVCSLNEAFLWVALRCSAAFCGSDSDRATRTFIQDQT